MICSHCQHPNRNTARICAKCGNPLPIGSAIGLGLILQGRYRVLRELGRGGMGAVYLAEDTQLFGRQWVVKEMLLPTDPADQREAERNFQREAQVLAGLRHPRIPAITHYFTEGGKYYLVMELADGENLEKRLETRGGPLPEHEVIDYAAQVCDVLEYLSNQNPPVVHRDIKPANIIVDSRGDIHLVDFGIARAKPILGAVVSRDTSLWGTQGYAPPEQFTGQTEPRSDVYALGATMHHLLTGHDPRDPSHQRFEPVNALAPNVSAGVAQLVEQMLDPTVDNRPTASELRQRLERIQSTEPLVFPSGQTAYSVQELVNLCDRHWSTAIQYLRNQYIEKWLKDIGRPDLAIHAKAIRVEVNRRKKTVDPSEALERLLRLLDPTRSQVQLDVAPSIFNIAIAQGDDVGVNVTVKSNGRYVSGTIEAQPSYYAPTPSTFACDAPTFSASVSIRFRPLGAGAGSNRALLLFKTRQATASLVVNYTIVAPLRFRSGVTVSKLAELAQVALQRWEDAVYHFKNGDISQWFQSWQRADLAAKADQLRSQGASGLAELLYLVNPNFAIPQVSITPSAIGLGDINRGTRREGTVAIANVAGGILYGHLSTVSSFVEVEPKEVICLPRQSKAIRVRVDASNLSGTARGQGYSAPLTFASNVGTMTIPLAWSVIHPPVLKIQPTRVRLRLERNVAPQASIEVVNAGGDVLVGEATTNAPWLTLVSPSTFSTPSGRATTINYSIESNQVDEKKRANVGLIHIHSNGGESSVTVEALLPRKFPGSLFLALLALALIFAFACGLGSLFLQANLTLAMLFAVWGFAIGVVIATTIALIVYLTS